MNIRLYEKLPGEAAEIRTAVFVEEQGFQNEFDEIDGYAKHLVLFRDGRAVAACRFFRRDEDMSYVIGRIAVVKEYRGQSLGSRLIKEVEKLVREKDGGRIVLHAQVQAKHFYEKLGYLAFGEMDYDEDCPHIWMQKKITAGETE